MARLQFREGSTVQASCCMLHHTRTSIGSDDVMMLRFQLFFFHTLRLRHIQVNKNAMSRTMKGASYLTWHIFDYRMSSWFQTLNMVQWWTTPYSNYCIHCQVLNTAQWLLYAVPDTKHYSGCYSHFQTLNIIECFLCTIPDTKYCDGTVPIQ
jgi:hypothetical protein